MFLSSICKLFSCKNQQEVIDSHDAPTEPVRPVYNKKDLWSLKSQIIGNVAISKHLSTCHKKNSNKHRHRCHMQPVGYETRVCLMTYCLLSGGDPSKVESPEHKKHDGPDFIKAYCSTWPEELAKKYAWYRGYECQRLVKDVAELCRKMTERTLYQGRPNEIKMEDYWTDERVYNLIAPEVIHPYLPDHLIGLLEFRKMRTAEYKTAKEKEAEEIKKKMQQQ